MASVRDAKAGFAHPDTALCNRYRDYSLRWPPGRETG